MRIQLRKLEWELGERVGRGGFGKVFAAQSGDLSAVVKLVPKSPGAEREMLFVDLDSVRNAVPIIDSGETETDWALAMPRADRSLRDYTISAGGKLSEPEVLSVLTDIAEALVDLEGRVVHRDLKPENILLLNGKWCLADFGISRYASATTAPDTHKFSMSPPYAAPERWREERADSSTDVYAVGVIAYELLAGVLPFTGSEPYEFREAHLRRTAPNPPAGSTTMRALVIQCLHKAQGARPGPRALLTRLQQMAATAPTGGLALLQEAAHAEVLRHSEAERFASEKRSEEERRDELFAAAESELQVISMALKTAITESAPPAAVQERDLTAWALRLGAGKLIFSSIIATSSSPWGDWDPPLFSVAAHASIKLTTSTPHGQYEGRSHSLWYCDAKEEGRFRWYETAFMTSPLIRESLQTVAPYALTPGINSAKALWRGMAKYQVAWPFTALDMGDLSEFVDRWAAWLAAASSGSLYRPGTMPERSSEGSWRS
ncbi:hypothetical protein CCS38_00125 [Streptomyces purpurogeneiscleroticus]|nr:hypothetical protein [Streptomyces purpurogeneiscleroticus]